MSLISPDVVAELKGLSFGASGFLLLVGFLLWAFGWRWHRFWVVFAFTTIAGMIGMTSGRAAGGQILVMGLLLAFCGGVLAIELAKILSFLAGGIVMWMVAQSVFPQAQELWAVFLSGGLFGVLLYRLWTMILLSFLGVVLSWHGAFSLAQATAKSDPVEWIATHTAALNGAVIVATLLGVVMQTITSESEAKTSENADDESKPHSKQDQDHDDTRGSWWNRFPRLKAA
jgi:hypothetical protein